MADRAPLVALLFDDAALSGHLRDALVEHGATIVYESDLHAFAPAELVGSSADVVVIDLDDPSDEDLDRLYDTVEGGHPRLVFNDADVTRTLAGWDRARWARHLAAKLVVAAPRDPPRPMDARAIGPRVDAVTSLPAPAERPLDEPLTDDLAMIGAHGYAETPMARVEEDTPVAIDTVPDIESDVEYPLVFSTTLAGADEDDDSGLDTDDLAAELEALLADSDADSLDRSDGLDDVPSAPLELTELASLDLSGFEVVDEALPERAQDSTLPLEIESRATQFVAPPVPEWDLVDHDTIVADTPPRPDAAEFGIETLSAAEYLAHDVVDDGSHGEVGGLSLELVSMEDAVAPRTDGMFAHEMFLEGSGRAVRRVVVLAGARDSEAAIVAFLAALPPRLPAVVLIGLHHDDTAALARRLGGLRIAGDSPHTAHGERLIVPRGAHVQIRRDGSVTVRDDGSAGTSTGPSIDGILATLATGFGADALVIAFAGQGADAVSGAQALYDAGGRVWVESGTSEADSSPMVAGIREERVASYAGNVAALAQKLIEEWP